MDGLPSFQDILQTSFDQLAARVEACVGYHAGELHARMNGIEDKLVSMSRRRPTLMGGSMSRRQQSMDSVDRPLSASQSRHGGEGAGAGEPAGGGGQIVGEDAVLSSLSRLASSHSHGGTATASYGFKLHEQWRRKHETALEVPSVPSQPVSETDWYQLEDELGMHASGRQSPGAIKGRPLMLRPSSPARHTWDILGMVCIAHDLVVVPLALGFGGDEEVFVGQTTLFWVVLAYWTTDIPLNFFTGIYRNGIEQLSHKTVALSYIKSWFLLDITIVAFDWIGVFADGASSRAPALARLGKLLRTMRIMRSLRLVRIMKLRRMVENMEDAVRSDFLGVILRIVKLIGVVLILNHFVACAWYAIGRGSGGWVKNIALNEEEIPYRYFTSLHWSLSQFTTGSMEVHAGTLAERIFNVTTLVFALVMLSSFISSITAAMSQLRELNLQNDKRLSMLRRYLKANFIPHNLTVRIMRYVEYTLTTQTHNVQERDVEFLTRLSKPLQMELQLHINQPTLVKHPFFSRLSSADRGVMQQLCNAALTTIPLSETDVLFMPWAQGNQMLYLLSGQLRYTLHKRLAMQQVHALGSTGDGHVQSNRSNASESQHAPRVPTVLTEDHIEWCAEGTLWTRWVHLGELRASQVSQVLGINSKEFIDIASVHGHSLQNVLRYAHAFVSKVNVLVELGCLSDLSMEEELNLEQLASYSFNPQVFGSRRQSRGSSTLSSLTSFEMPRAWRRTLSGALGLNGNTAKNSNSGSPSPVSSFDGADGRPGRFSPGVEGNGSRRRSWSGAAGAASQERVVEEREDVVNSPYRGEILQERGEDPCLPAHDESAEPAEPDDKPQVFMSVV